jgi:N-methylhydantoinase A
LLGRLDPAKLKSVEGGVNLDDVHAIFDEKLGAPLGLSAVASAAAVIRIANAKMAGAIRMVSISLGADPRDFALFAFGGAGPMHAAALARELGVPTVLMPARPGITNALGCALADLRHDFVRTLNQPLNALDETAVAEVFQDQITQGEALLDRETVELVERRHIHSVDMQFVGQSHILRVPLDGPSPSRQDLRERFEAAYMARFKIALDEIRSKLVNINTSVIGVRPPLDLSLLIDPAGRQANITDALTSSRPVFFDTDWVETPIYARERLPIDAAFSGPAIIEQMDTTIVLEPGDRVTGDTQGNLIIHVGAG